MAARPGSRVCFHDLSLRLFDLGLFSADTFFPGYCIGQIRCLFTLPKKARARWFNPKFPHHHFAYVEWFTAFVSSRFDTHSKMYRISRLHHPANKGGHRKASVVPISLIKESIHLFPKFGPVAPAEWRSSNILEVAPAFYVNPLSDCLVYSTVI